ncbi:MAG TPA: hypothetical protein VN762_00145, partial [Steroidobacteraceae bacterium]|nr:hypothetical protein [Steroidobacteraceae bacterium]
MRRSLVLAVLFSGALAGPAAQAAKAPAQPTHIPATRVQDLHFGDVLFQTFLGEDVEALTRLEAYSHWGLMPHHLGEADLLAGGLYLQLG